MRSLLKVKLASAFLLSLFILSAQEEQQTRKDRILKLLGQSEVYLYDDPEKAISYANEAYELALDLDNDSLLAVTLNSLGGARWSLGNIDEALPVFQYSIQLCKKNRYTGLLAKNYGNMGNVYASANLHYDAIGYYKKELQIQKGLINNKFRKFAINSNIGREYQLLNVFDSSMYYFKGAQQFMDSSFVNLYSIFYCNIAELRFKRGNINGADSILVSALKNAEHYNSKRGICKINRLLAEIALKRGNAQRAFDHAILAHNLAEETGKKELLLLSNQILSKCYASFEDYENAYKHESLHRKYKELLYGTDSRKRLELLSYEQRQLQLRKLGAEKEKSKSQALTRQKTIYFLISGLLVSCFLIAMIIDRNRRIKAQSIELEVLNDFKTRLFAVISHDIRSPIQSISMIIDMLDERQITEEELRMLIPDIRKKTDRLNDLLASLFQWAQGRLSEKTFNKEKFKLLPLIAELNEELTDRITEKNIAIRLEIADDFEVFGDQGIIRVVLRNLLVNAIKFSWRKSEVVLKAMMVGKKAAVEVIDQGMGMSKEEIQGLFNMEIASKDGTSGEKGSGLGIVLCNDFMKGQGGEIEVQSELGFGSTFRILLPMKDV